MKCSLCKGDKGFKVEEHGVVLDGVYWRCPHCNGTGQEPITNVEYIRSCKKKDLAVLLVTIALYPMDFEPYRRYMEVCADGATEKDFVDMTIKWLKEKRDEQTI